jgi:hypothetical protein
MPIKNVFTLATITITVFFDNLFSIDAVKNYLLNGFTTFKNNKIPSFTIMLLGV